MQYDEKAIEAEKILKMEKLRLKKEKYPKKPSRFGSAEFFRRYKKVKPKFFDRVEPPILKQTNSFKGESALPPVNQVLKLNRHYFPDVSDLI